MEINWTVLTYFVIGLFILNGFFRGWWKEAITTVFLVILVFFLQQPSIAEAFTNIINTILNTIWEFLPDSLVELLRNFFENGLGVQTATNGAIQADPSNGTTWLIVLVLFLVIAGLIGRSSLPYGRSGYAVRPIGSILGGLVGGLNGLILINLVREYLDGRNLPGGTGTLPAEISMAGQGGGRVASAGLSIQATQLPDFTILDSFLPWIIIIIGLFIFWAALINRVGISSKDGFRKVDYRQPFGYKRY
ncbi:MAG: hypothetical protein AB1801_01215 [Chloroflexota bacterium]